MKFFEILAELNIVTFTVTFKIMTKTQSIPAVVLRSLPDENSDKDKYVGVRLVAQGWGRHF